MTIDDKRLLPCPHCGGKAEITYNGPTAEQVKHAISWGDDVDWQYYGECAHCGATGPACISETEAIAAWNRRPSPARPADGAGLVAALRDIYETDDHARGCEGRTYNCTCGFDDRTFATAKRAAEALSRREWQPIETAPHGVEVLLATPPFKCMGEQARWELRVGMASWGERIGGISNRSRDSWATHWMPLPTPPAASQPAGGGDD